MLLAARSSERESVQDGYLSFVNSFHSSTVSVSNCMHSSLIPFSSNLIRRSRLEFLSPRSFPLWLPSLSSWRCSLSLPQAWVCRDSGCGWVFCPFGLNYCPVPGPLCGFAFAYIFQLIYLCREHEPRILCLTAVLTRVETKNGVSQPAQRSHLITAFISVLWPFPAYFSTFRWGFFAMEATDP